MTQPQLFYNGFSGAQFSSDRKYRYALWRVWDTTKPVVMFVGLNPSTANEEKDDPTIRRVTGMAKAWGYGGVYMLNLFAWVSPYPEDLLHVADPLGANDAWLDQIGSRCERVVFAWGSFKQARERAAQVIQRYPGAYCLRVNKDGSPNHPLYVPAAIKPVLYSPTQT